jgi:hypothetical protein
MSGPLNNVRIHSIFFVSILLLGLVAAPTLSSVKATNEGSYTYGYWQGSLTGPQNDPGLNQNTELGNTCQIGPSSTLSNGTTTCSN